jgi:hypothetical protein
MENLDMRERGRPQDHPIFQKPEKRMKEVPYLLLVPLALTPTTLGKNLHKTLPKIVIFVLFLFIFMYLCIFICIFPLIFHMVIFHGFSQSYPWDLCFTWEKSSLL